MKRTTLIALLALAGPPLAQAEPWDIKAGAGPVYATTFQESRKDGIGFQAYLEMGLTESWSLVAGGGYNDHLVDGGESYELFNAGLGVAFSLDVLVIVPFFATRVGWLQRRGGSEDIAGLGFSFSLGFDYLWTESFTLGLAAEYHGMLTDLPTFPGYAAFTARIGFRLPG